MNYRNAWVFPSLNTSSKICYILLRSVIVCLFGILTGCASVNQALLPETISSTDMIAVKIEQKNKVLKMLDHTYARTKTYPFHEFGAAGHLVDGIILGIETKSKIKKSLGGNLKELKNNVDKLDLKEKIYAQLDESISSKFKIIYLKGSDDLGKDVKKRRVKDLISEASDAGADLYLDIKYEYGVAVYDALPSSVAIDAMLYFYDTKTKKRLLKKSISSDEIFTNFKRVNQLSENNARQFYSDIEQAIKFFSLLISSELDLHLDEVHKLRIETLDKIIEKETVYYNRH